MLGLIVIVGISWGLLYLFERKHIDELGIIPTPIRLGHFTIGFIVMSFIVLINIYAETIIKETVWTRNEFKYSNIWNAFIYHLRSALTEDLIFRGAILYILIKRIGAYKAIILSSFIFGVYHWFSYGILNERWILLIYIFIITGANGFVWAYSFYKTRSIMFGLGLHTGSNLLLSCFYKSQTYGEIIFALESSKELSGWASFFFSFSYGLFPSVCTFLILMIWLKSKAKSSKNDELLT